jgi:hypothetical protein
MSRQYTAILERDVDNGFVASVPVLPGCVSQGDTRVRLSTFMSKIASSLETLCPKRILLSTSN